MNAEERYSQADIYYRAGLYRVKTTSPPDGQKYPPGTRVRITDDLGPSMRHFPSGKNATVKYTYAHAYGGGDVKTYCLAVEGHGEISWYSEEQIEEQKESDRLLDEVCIKPPENLWDHNGP